MRAAYSFLVSIVFTACAAEEAAPPLSAALEAPPPRRGFSPMARLEALRPEVSPAPPLDEAAPSMALFETPKWRTATSGGAPARRAAASAGFYRGAQDCIVVFGGLDANTLAGGAYRDDVAVRCEGAWQSGIPIQGAAPSGRQDAPLAYGTFADASQNGMYLFGGYDGTVHDDLWRFELTGAANGPRSGSWQRIAPRDPLEPDRWPAPRTEAGLVALPNGGLLLFGGFSFTAEFASDRFLTDTWRWDGGAWHKLCDGAGCFPAHRGFIPMVIGSGFDATVAIFGGFEQTGAVRDRLYVFVDNGASGHWSLVTTDTSAPLPTSLDGRIFRNEVRPSPRFAGWSAPTSDGALLGSGASGLFGKDDPLDVWRIERTATGLRWRRVPVNDVTPGRRIGGSAAFDSVRQEVVVVGGVSNWVSATEPPELAAVPVASYQHVAGTSEMRVVCRDPGDTGDCTRYSLEASATLSGGAASDVRATFVRLAGTTWSVAGASCGTHTAPLAADADGTIRCEVTPGLLDSAYAVELFDRRYSGGGSLCALAPHPTLPLCNPAGSYAGHLGCRHLPVSDGAQSNCQ